MVYIALFVEPQWSYITLFERVVYTFVPGLNYVNISTKAVTETFAINIGMYYLFTANEMRGLK